MTPEVEHPPRSKALSYASTDNSNQQTVGHMRTGESHGEGRGCGSGTRVSAMLQVKQNISPPSALPAIQHQVFINLHPIPARDRDTESHKKDSHTYLHAVQAHTRWHVWSKHTRT